MTVEPRDHQTVRRIKNAHLNDESLGYVIHGPRGSGKTVWGCIIGSQCVGTTAEPRWDERLKNWIRFTPAQFCKMCLDCDDVQIWAFWDDFSFWANKMFWYEPFVKEALRFATLQRTCFSALMMSTPSLQMIPNKVLDLEDVMRVRIIKETSNAHSPIDKPRTAIVTKPWHSDYNARGGCSLLYREKFSCWFPDDFYKWYAPARKLYSVLAKVNMKRSLERQAGSPMKVKGQELLEDLMKRAVIPGPEEIKELHERVKAFASALEVEEMRRQDQKKLKKEQRERELQAGIEQIERELEGVDEDGEGTTTIEED